MTPQKLNSLFKHYEVTPTKLIDFYETLGFDVKNLHHQISIHRNKADKIATKSQILYAFYFTLLELKRKDLININLFNNTLNKLTND